jgi:hypothetical protein
MLGGDDSVAFGTGVPVTVEGNVSIDGGDGANSILANDLTVLKNLTVTNGTAAIGFNGSSFLNLSVGGNVTIKSTGGDTSTSIERNAAGNSTIKGNLTVTNGTGTDAFFMFDTNVDGGVTINNGHGSAAGTAGSIDILNNYNSAYRSVIGKNLTVTYLDGNVNGYDGLWDTEVMGNVTLNHGPGAFTTETDGFGTNLPVLVHGNFSILGTGTNSVYAGNQGRFTGLTVGKKFTITVGGGSAETVEVYKLLVGGNTSITLGNGGNTVYIDDSAFNGTFALLSGAGNDTLNLETSSGTNSATEFKKTVLINLGGGTGNLVDFEYGGNPSTDAGQVLVFWSTAKLLNVYSTITASEADFVFPNGNHLQIN